jgi:membrane protease subunit HflK
LTRRVCRYQRGNQNPYIEEEQTTQWPKEKVQKDKQRLINEAQTYANGILPKSRGRAARILEEARGYKSKVISKSEGEASRYAP